MERLMRATMPPPQVQRGLDRITAALLNKTLLFSQIEQSAAISRFARKVVDDFNNSSHTADAARAAIVSSQALSRSMTNFAPAAAVMSQQQLAAKVAVPSPALQLQINKMFASVNGLPGEAIRSFRKSMAAVNSAPQLQEAFARLGYSVQTPAISNAFAAALYKPVASSAAISALADAVNRTLETERDDIVAVAEAASPADDVAGMDTANVTTFQLYLIGLIWSACVVYCWAAEDWIQKQPAHLRAKCGERAKGITDNVIAQVIAFAIVGLPAWHFFTTH
jgi:hypothetical protein